MKDECFTGVVLTTTAGDIIKHCLHGLRRYSFFQTNIGYKQMMVAKAFIDHAELLNLKMIIGQDIIDT